MRLVRHCDCWHVLCIVILHVYKLDSDVDDESVLHVLCMCINMYIYAYVCIYTFMYICIYTFMYICIRMPTNYCPSTMITATHQHNNKQ